MTMTMRLLALAAMVVGLVPALAGAAPTPTAGVERLEVRQRTEAFAGKTFGDHGAYERITAVAHMRIDPAAPANRLIADLALAPRGKDGRVAYDVDVIILRPKDAARARRVLVFDVVNRGSKVVTGLNGATGLATGEDQPGDGFLMRQGYTLVWIGWQADLAPAMVQARFPIARGKAGPAVGMAEQEFIADDGAVRSAMTLPFAAADLNPARATLTVQARAADPPRTLAAGHWRYLDERHVQFDLPADMDAGAIYRLRYPARDPVVGGLGFAAVRDVIAFLRHEARDGRGGANPLADLARAPCERDGRGLCLKTGGGNVDIAVGYGVSQSGRFLRDWLWQGFNTDLAGRPVFEGLMPNIPGGRTTWTNVRFAQPGRFSRQHEDHGVFGFGFPFAYGVITDPVTGARDGLLKRCAADRTCPKVIQVDTSAEFWQAGAALVGTAGTRADVALPANVRLFLVAGGTHTTGMASKTCQNPANPMSAAPVQKALLADLVDWVAGRAAPPASRWPSLADGSLAPVGQIGFPDLSAIGVSPPAVVNRPMPPPGRPGWPVFVPAVDADGQDRAGVRLPEVATPLGTHLGWNLRRPGFAGGELCNLYGSYVPFAAGDTAPAGDPRLPVGKRYPNQAAYVAAVGKAAQALRADRLMLDEDVEAALAKARAMPWPDPQPR